MLICRIGQNSEDSFDRQCIICRISRISEDFCSAMFELPHHLSVGCPKITLFSTVPDLPPISKSSLPLISRIYEDWIVRLRSVSEDYLVRKWSICRINCISEVLR